MYASSTEQATQATWYTVSVTMKQATPGEGSIIMYVHGARDKQTKLCYMNRWNENGDPVRPGEPVWGQGGGGLDDTIKFTERSMGLYFVFSDHPWVSTRYWIVLFQSGDFNYRAFRDSEVVGDVIIFDVNGLRYDYCFLWLFYNESYWVNMGDSDFNFVYVFPSLWFKLGVYPFYHYGFLHSLRGVIFHWEVCW